MDPPTQITDEDSYQVALAECDTLCQLDPPLGTAQAARLLALAIALEAYEKPRWPIGGAS